MKSINQTQILGNVGRDPEIRTLGSGERVANLRVATNDTWTQNGEKKSKTEWHNVVIYNPNLIETVEKYVKKGDPIQLMGLKIQYRTFTDSKGVEKQVTDLVLQRFGGDLILMGNGSGNGADNGGSSDGLGGNEDDPWQD
ncbi:single-stranded DNA-binding protein [Microvirga sp. VF16]|uniref:single-stranded DNA-binding protein n=1 Tax=Microvirga sp. VF16 TaxID=2807101 RepID=UPI00193CAF79|nr:single-stranded DNA-binding protein [Microvirga sp. VF16]QRM35072.1 single-stranded DNA-binding protein [Microvirga sp. VF16]